jgi:hypothetical protein
VACGSGPDLVDHCLFGVCSRFSARDGSAVEAVVLLHGTRCLAQHARSVWGCTGDAQEMYWRCTARRQGELLRTRRACCSYRGKCKVCRSTTALGGEGPSSRSFCTACMWARNCGRLKTGRIGGVSVCGLSGWSGGNCLCQRLLSLTIGTEGRRHAAC